MNAIQPTAEASVVPAVLSRWAVTPATEPAMGPATGRAPTQANGNAERGAKARSFARNFALGAHVALVAVTLAVPAAVPALATAILVGLLVAASYADLRWRRVPNWLTYPAAAWTLVLAAATNQLNPAGVLSGTTAGPPLTLAGAAMGFAACFAAMLLVYCCEGLGAGDVKLAGAIGAALGVQAGLSTVAWCLVLAAGSLLIWRATHADWRRVACLVALRVGLDPPFAELRPRVETPRPELPLAGFFALGAVLTLNGGCLL